MNTRDIVFPVAVLDEDEQPVSLAGSAFPVTPDGGLLTCLHVVNRVDGNGVQIRVGIIDAQQRRIYPIEEHFSPPPDAGLDIAYLPLAGGRPTPCYLPILDPDEVLMGSDANMLGYYSGALPFEVGSFRGSAVAVSTERRHQRIRLSYPVIEGCSGSPLLTYHNGTKVAGMAYGSESQRIQTYEVVDVQDGESRYRETVHRIVEFGLAHHASAVIWFLESHLPHELTTQDARGFCCRSSDTAVW
ncbi:MAG: serine protease [Solirubrobacterales bacterium]